MTGAAAAARRLGRDWPALLGLAVIILSTVAAVAGQIRSGVVVASPQPGQRSATPAARRSRTRGRRCRTTPRPLAGERRMATVTAHPATSRKSGAVSPRAFQ